MRTFIVKKILRLWDVEKKDGKMGIQDAGAVAAP